MPERHRRGLGALLGTSLVLASLVTIALSVNPARAVADNPPSCPWIGPDAQALSPATRAAMLVSAMSLDDQIALLNLDVGPDKENILGDQPAYCIPEFVLQDGPNGVSSSGGYALPASIATAATFDPTAAHDYGVALAMSAEAKGHTAVQAPDLNLAVVPSWGRIGETYGEDPFLAGLMGTAESHAVVDSGSQVLIKHLSVYTHEQNRGGANTTVGTTTREEVFEAPFRQVVKAVNPLGVMCAYGTVNGVPNCADPDLVARYRAWGGTGFIRTDLKAQSSPIAALNAGVGVFKPTLQAEMRSAVDRGAISAELIATRATDLMTDLFARGLMDHPRAPLVAKADARAQCVTTATEVANESLVLLKNSGVLPLSSKTGSLAIMGSAAALSPTYALGGSSYVPLKSPVSFAQALISAVKPAKTVIQPSMPKMPATVLMRRQQSDGTGATTTTSLSFTAPHRGRYLAELGLNYGESSAVVRVDGQQYGWVLVQRGDGIRHTTWVMTLDPGVHKVDITWQSAGPTPVFTIQDVEAVLLQAAATARSVDIPVVFVASASSEDYDHNTLGLPGFQDALIQTVALANPKTVVVIEAARPVAMPWLPLVSAVLDTWLVGQIGGKPVADALTGAVNPSGHLPITFPETFGNSIAGDGLTQIQHDGNQNLISASGKPAQFGMHYFQSKHLTPLFPFGFGLSYTTFSAKNLVVQATPTGWTISASVTNTGSVTGRAVLQAYVTYPSATGEMTQQLKAIGSVTLSPGGTQRLSLNLDRSSLEIVRAENWFVPKGTYTVDVGWSAADLPLQGTFSVR